MMRPMAARSPLSATLRALALLAVVGASAMGAVAISGAAEATLPTLLLLVAEPLVWVILVAAALHAGLSRRGGALVVALSALVALGTAVRRPPPHLGPTEASAEAGPTVRHCVAKAEMPPRALRIATWNAAHHPDRAAATEALLSLDADLLVVQEVDEEFVDGIAGALQDRLSRRAVASAPRGLHDADEEPIAEGLFVRAEERWGHGLVVRDGFFGVCGAEQKDAFGISVPTAGDHEALASLAFPMIDDTVIPVMAVHLDTPALKEVGAWPALIGGSAERLSSFVSALNAPSLIVLGDSATHGTFRRFHGRLQDAGLLEVPGRASWPTNVAGIPSLPLYHVDRIWHGAAWELEDVETVRMPSDHMAVVANLAPREPDPG